MTYITHRRYNNDGKEKMSSPDNYLGKGDSNYNFTIFSDPWFAYGYTCRLLRYTLKARMLYILVVRHILERGGVLKSTVETFNYIKKESYTFSISTKVI
jgi:hypothetical protein